MVMLHLACPIVTVALFFYYIILSPIFVHFLIHLSIHLATLSPQWWIYANFCDKCRNFYRFVLRICWRLFLPFIARLNSHRKVMFLICCSSAVSSLLRCQRCLIMSRNWCLFYVSLQPTFLSCEHFSLQQKWCRILRNRLREDSQLIQFVSLMLFEIEISFERSCIFVVLFVCM